MAPLSQPKTSIALPIRKLLVAHYTGNTSITTASLATTSTNSTGMLSLQLLGLLTVTSTTVAQLLGCDNIDCPIDANNGGLASCQLGNVTAAHLGIAQVNTSLSPEPLTWTLGLSLNSNVNSGEVTRIWGKDFYLGQPSALNLQSSVGVGACGIFLHGASSSLKFHEGSPSSEVGSDNGNCGDALTPQCVSELEAQALQVTQSVESFDGNVTCGVVAEQISANVPPSCQQIPDLWTNISSHAIAGPELLAPIQLTNCVPTVSSNYSVTLVEELQLVQEGVTLTPEISEFQHGITPIFTILLPGSSRGDQAIAEVRSPEAHLSCLKTLSTGSSNDAGTIEGAAWRHSQGSAALVSAVAFACWTIFEGFL